MVHRSSLRLAVALAGVVLGASSACGSATTGGPAVAPADGPTAAAGPSPEAPEVSAVSPEQLVVPRAFIEALNRGDSAAAQATFAPTARFDSVGRVYPDRQAIFARFIDPEVIGAGGRYVERSSQVDGDRIVVEYDFTTRSGAEERFTYAYLVRDALIVDVVGRYT